MGRGHPVRKPALISLPFLPASVAYPCSSPLGASARAGTAAAPRRLSPNPEKTSAGHHHLNVPPRRPAQAVVGLDPHATVGPGVIPERRAIVKPRKREPRLQRLLVRAGKRRPIQHHKT